MFTENLRRLRCERFLSQAELARRAGLHALTVTRLEAGAAAPATRTVRALAEVLGVQPGDLAAPGEVAELRHLLGEAAQPAGEASDRLEHWGDDGGAPGRGSAGPADPIAGAPGATS
jgi:transcriptional regulator with XRE-family HTH domain